MKRAEHHQPVAEFVVKPAANDWGTKTFAELVRRQKAGLPLLDSSDVSVENLMEALEYPSPFKEEKLVDLILRNQPANRLKLFLESVN